MIIYYLNVLEPKLIFNSFDSKMFPFLCEDDWNSWETVLRIQNSSCIWLGYLILVQTLTENIDQQTRDQKCVNNIIQQYLRYFAPLLILLVA